MRAVLVGEGMLELSQEGAAWRLGYGGDTLNTAIHLARAGIETAYLTAVGSDPFSADLKAKWQGEGLDTSLILTHPTRGSGLYAINTDERGERSFTYWRGESAARAGATEGGRASDIVARGARWQTVARRRSSGRRCAKLGCLHPQPSYRPLQWVW